MGSPQAQVWCAAFLTDCAPPMPVRGRMAGRRYDPRSGQGGVRREVLLATPHVLSINPPGAPGLCWGRAVDKPVCRRRTDPVSLELVRYTVAGGLASLVDVGLLVGLTIWVGVYYLHAAGIAFGVGLLTSYLLSIAWVFQERRFQNPCVELGLFTLIGGLGLLWCGGYMWFLTEYAHLHYLCSKMGAALVVFLWNFFAKKWLLFHR